MAVSPNPLRFVDLFCGIGGFHIAADLVCRERFLPPQCVFACDTDPDAQKAYQANFGIHPAGDITGIPVELIPDHDILFAGFPCQPFSILGDRRGFEDTRGTLFFDVARIIAAKRPAAFILENVKQLRGHDSGRTLKVTLETLDGLGYHTDWRILNALNFGLPQKRERILIVGFRQPHRFVWPVGGVPMLPLTEILEKDEDVPDFYWASDKIRQARLERREGKKTWDVPTIWHENKGGNISAYPYSCALRAGASYNYLLVNGERRLTEREMLRLQGFPETFKIVCGYGATRKQVGNSVAVPCIAAVFRAVMDSLELGIETQPAPCLTIKAQTPNNCIFRFSYDTIKRLDNVIMQEVLQSPYATARFRAFAGEVQGFGVTAQDALNALMAHLPPDNVVPIAILP